MGMPRKPYHFSTLEPHQIPGIRLGDLPDAWRCRAQAKSTGDRCRAVAAKGMGLCRHHGAGGNKPSLAKVYRMAARLRGERPTGWSD